MDRNNLNIVVFDEEESFVATEQSRINNSVVRRQNSQYGLNSSNVQTVISSEIHMLTEKIKNLQDKTNKIEESLRTTNQFTSSVISSASSIPTNSSHLDELLKVVETKIQVIILETKKIIERLATEFDRKLAQGTGQKDRQQASIVKIQKHCRDSIAQIQQHYQKQLMFVKEQHQELETRLIQRVEEVEREYRKKVSMFENKESEYLSTIEVLENKVRIANKNKKMIEITQEKPNTSIRCDMLDNFSGANNTNSRSISGMNPNDTSISKRRTKIFDSKRSNRSVSPYTIDNSQKILSPFKAPTVDKLKQSQSVAKLPNSKSATTYETPHNNYYPSQTIKSQVSPDFMQGKKASSKTSVRQEQFASSKMSDYNKPSEPQYSNKENSRGQPVKTFIRDQSQKQFLRDVPKAHWERFQDYDQNESSGSDEDVFFYPEHTQGQKEEPQVYNYKEGSNNAKMFSPFDVN